jgi:hypothetical protein
MPARVTIRTARQGTPTVEAIKRVSALFARPSTGGAFTRMRSMSPLEGLRVESSDGHHTAGPPRHG